MKYRWLSWPRLSASPCADSQPSSLLLLPSHTHLLQFFKLYTELLRSDNYVTRRQSLKLLGELLLDRSNVKIMMQYVADVDNLCLMMNLLKDPSRSIQFEAFHVFKVLRFAAASITVPSVHFFSWL